MVASSLATLLAQEEPLQLKGLPSFGFQEKFYKNIFLVLTDISAGRRNLLQMEQSRTMSKNKSMAPTKSEGTIQNPNLSVGNTKSNPATAHLMPPPTVPLGKCFLIID